MQQILDALVAKLPPAYQKYAKALVPLALTVIAAGASWAITGTFDGSEIKLAVLGLLTSGGVLKVRNTDHDPSLETDLSDVAGP